MTRRDDDPWADEDLPDGTPEPDLLDLARDFYWRWRGPIVVLLLCLALLAGSMLVVVGALRGYRTLKGGPATPCFAVRREPLDRRLEREVACEVIRRNQRP
jgi:putative intracellular protease/amidase